MFSHTLHKEAVRKISTSVPVRHGTRTIKQVGWLAVEQLCMLHCALGCSMQTDSVSKVSEGMQVVCCVCQCP